MRLNEVWSWDFVHDRTDNGVPLKMLTLIDEYSRQCLRIEVGRKLKSKDVLDALAGAVVSRK
jgi:transposase InsO family protein